MDGAASAELNISGYPAAEALLLRLRHKIDPDHHRPWGRAYITSLGHDRQIYAHSDTLGDYFYKIERYQFYLTGSEGAEQLIGGERFPALPGMFYFFDHRQIHHYANHGTEDLVILVFDLYKV